jgi:hypothetical protein
MPIVIVEGPDCAGKTTFVEQLAKTLPRPPVLIHSGPPDPPDRDPYEEYEQVIDEVYADPFTVVVADRHHWGEVVYGDVFGRESRLHRPSGWRHVELFLASRGAIVVYLHQPRHVLEQCLKQRGDDLVEPYMYDQILAGYDWCLRNTVLPVICLRRPTLMDAGGIAYMVTNRLLATRTFYHESTYIGQRRPEVLLFGERRGGQPPHADRAAFVPRGGTSGRYLLSALPEDLWPRIGIVNACEDSPRKTWALLDHPPAVALGRAADEALTRSGIPHASVPHPQFVRRFLHREMQTYGRLIADVAGTKDDMLGWRGDTGS